MEVWCTPLPMMVHAPLLFVHMLRVRVRVPDVACCANLIDHRAHV